MLRVILDANVFLSYLIAPDSEKLISQVVRACFDDDIDLVMPKPLLDEVVEKLAQKNYFQQRVRQDLIDSFAEQMQILSQLIETPETITSFTRDPDDDYLVAYGLVNDVDFLVTGDKDLLVLGTIGTLKVITPRTFYELLTK